MSLWLSGITLSFHKLKEMGWSISLQIYNSSLGRWKVGRQFCPPLLFFEVDNFQQPNRATRRVISFGHLSTFSTRRANNNVGLYLFYYMSSSLYVEYFVVLVLGCGSFFSCRVVVGLINVLVDLFGGPFQNVQVDVILMEFVHYSLSIGN